MGQTLSPESCANIQILRKLLRRSRFTRLNMGSSLTCCCQSAIRFASELVNRPTLSICGTNSIAATRYQKTCFLLQAVFCTPNSSIFWAKILRQRFQQKPYVCLSMEIWFSEIYKNARELSAHKGDAMPDFKALAFDNRNYLTSTHSISSAMVTSPS